MVKIYHNPRCTKSRQTLEMLQENGVEPDVRLYLQDALSLAELAALADMLGDDAARMVRHKEAEYRQAGLTADSSRDEILQAIVAFPKLLERPIVVCGDKAAIGRPPEDVLAIL